MRSPISYRPIKKINKLTIIKLLLILFLCLIIIQPIATLKGAKTGLLLWFNTVLPTLLPFIIISNLIIHFRATNIICKVFSPILKRLFHVSTTGCYPLIIGILSGYPMGAKTCADLIKTGDLTVLEGQYIMTLASNASFMFLTSFLAVSSLCLPNKRYQLLFILYLSSFITASIYRKRSKTIALNKRSYLKSSQKEAATTIDTENTMLTIDQCILDGFITVTKIGGYIILFSVLAQIFLQFLYPFGIIKYLLLGTLEITTGIFLVCSASFSITKKIVLTMVITGFGGFSSLAQIGSVILHSGLSLSTYLRYKILNSFITFLLIVLYITLFNII